MRWLILILLMVSCGGEELPAPKPDVIWTGIESKLDRYGDPEWAVSCNVFGCTCYQEMELTDCPPVSSREEAMECCGGHHWD